MADWTKSMRQTYEFYRVDPLTWANDEKLDNVTECSITWDETLESLGSVELKCVGGLDECYVRIYLVINQNGVDEKLALGTFLVQSPTFSFDGKIESNSIGGYTPLIELKEKPPQIGYAVRKGANIMAIARRLCEENMRAPIGGVSSNKTLKGNFIANTDDTWLSFLRDLISNAEYEFDIDALGKILFKPITDTASLRPVWTFNDDNSSILMPSVTDDRDLYGIPNVVIVQYTNSQGNTISVKVSNNYKNSPTSIQSRGREIVYRDTNPNFSTDLAIDSDLKSALKNYAENTLRNLSCLEHKITFSHGYCGTRLGDAVRLNYERAGLSNVKAKIVAQKIKCGTGCTVEETAVYTTDLWVKGGVETWS